MDVRPTLGRSGRRLALATCAVALVAAAFSGPAVADPGFSGLLSGVTEPLPPAVSDPVADAGSSVDSVVEQVQAEVAGAVTTVEQTTELVDTTVSDGLTGVEQTVDSTLGAVDVTVGAVSGTSQSPSSALPTTGANQRSTAGPADTTAGPAETVAVLPPTPAETTTPEAARRIEDATRPIDLAQRSPASDSVPSGAPARSSEGPAYGPATHTALRAPDRPAAVGNESRDAGGAAPRSPQLPSHGDALGLEWLVPQPPAPALLIAVLLGLLALAMPRSGGRRLHPAVAMLRPADVRFRLVRPG